MAFKLKDGIDINGANFVDGSRNITAGNISATTVTANLTGTATKATNVVGGAQGSIPYQTAADTTTTLAKGSAFQALVMNSGATAPEWKTLDMTYVPNATFKKSARVATTADLAASSRTSTTLTGYSNSQSLACTTTAGSTTVTTTSTAGLKVGATISTATAALAAGTTVASITSITQFTVNNRANITTTAITGNGTTATATFAAQTYAPYAVGSSITISGATPSTYNGTFVVTACTTTSVSWASIETVTATVQGTIAFTIAAGTSITTAFSQTIAALVIDGVTVALNDRILVKNQTTIGGLDSSITDNVDNGIYYVSTLGTTSVPWVLTRAIDADTSAEIASSMVAVDEGSTYGGWMFDNDFKTTDTLGSTAMPWNSIADSGKKLNYFAATTSSELAGVISDETGSGSLVFGTSPTITTPKISTSINDTNGNELIKVTATASAVNEITVTNAATGGVPSITATGGDTNVSLNLAGKGTGVVTTATAAADTNTTQIATTAFVVGQASATTPIVNGTATIGSSLKYARADHIHPTDTSRQAALGYTPVNKAGDTMSGELTFSDDGEGVTLYGGARIYKKVGGGLALRRHTADVDPVIENNAGTASYKIWHEGNDGSGSTLDADTLDTYHAGNATGQIPISNGTVNVNLNAEKVGGVDATRIPYGDNSTASTNVTDVNNIWKSGFYEGIDITNAPSTGWYWIMNAAHKNNTSSYKYNGQIAFKNLGSGVSPEAYIRTTQGNITSTNWARIWTDQNDGSGSGLDADKLDGNEASAFALAGHTHAYLSAESDTLATVTGRGATTSTNTTFNGTLTSNGNFTVSSAVTAYLPSVVSDANELWSRYTTDNTFWINYRNNAGDTTTRNMTTYIGDGKGGSIIQATGGATNLTQITGRVGIGRASATYALEVNGDIYNTGWIRTTGTSPVYFQDYGGGFNMSDTTWIRTYGSKSFYHDTGIMRTDGTLQVGNAGATLNVPTGGDFNYKAGVLFASYVNSRVGINNAAPTVALDVTGAIEASLTITGTQLVSTVATGTSPLTVTSTTKVTNLNVDQLDGYHADTAATANTVMVRQANGYSYSVHHNLSRADETSAAASYVYDSGDGWLRKKTLANARAEIVTASDILTKLLTVDGSGSGVDSDKLDGQEGSYYLAWGNLTGKPTTISGYGITDAYTKSEMNTFRNETFDNFAYTGGAVTATANSLEVSVAAGTFYVGGIRYATSTTTKIATASVANWVYINSSGVVTIATTAPTGDYAALAYFTAPASGVITGIVDTRNIITNSYGAYTYSLYSSGYAQTITQRGSGGALLIKDGSTDKFIVDANGNTKLYNGADFFVYSDGGTTQKFFIDGATGDTSTSGVVTITKSGDGVGLLKLTSERGWTFKQSGIGAAASLLLESDTDSKTFKISCVGQTTPVFTAYATSTLASQTVTINGNLNVNSTVATVDGNDIIHKGSAKYNTWDGWLRYNGDSSWVKMYGNGKTMVFRTDGTTAYNDNGAYPFVWLYGGDAAVNRKMVLDTSGNIWTPSYGWIDDKFLIKSGDTMTGHLTLDVSGGEKQVKCSSNWGMYMNTGGMGCYDWANSRPIWSYSASANTTSWGNSNVVTNLNADKLDGYHVNDSGTGATWGYVPVVKSDGVMDIGKYVDFHESSAQGNDYTVRLDSTGGWIRANGYNLATEGSVTYGTLDSFGFRSGSYDLGNGYRVYYAGAACGANTITTFNFPAGTFGTNPSVMTCAANPNNDYTNYSTTGAWGITNIATTYVKIVNYDLSKPRYLFIMAIGQI